MEVISKVVLGKGEDRVNSAVEERRWNCGYTMLDTFIDERIGGVQSPRLKRIVPWIQVLFIERSLKRQHTVASWINRMLSSSES